MLQGDLRITGTISKEESNISYSTVIVDQPKIGEIWYTKDTGRTFIVEKLSDYIAFGQNSLKIHAYVLGEDKEDNFFFGKNNMFQWVKINGIS